MGGQECEELVAVRQDGDGKCPIHQIYQVCEHHCLKPAHPGSMVRPGWPHSAPHVPMIELQKTAFAIPLPHPSSFTGNLKFRLQRHSVVAVSSQNAQHFTARRKRARDGGSHNALALVSIEC